MADVEALDAREGRLGAEELGERGPPRLLGGLRGEPAEEDILLPPRDTKQLDKKARKEGRQADEAAAIRRGEG